MKRKCFAGVAVHPRHLDPRMGAMVGVWLKRKISQRQRQEIMRLNENLALGHIGVRVGNSGTAVMYLGPISDEKAARKLAASLVRSVAKITGVTSILRRLPNYRAVSLALAG